MAGLQHYSDVPLLLSEFTQCKWAECNSLYHRHNYTPHIEFLEHLWAYYNVIQHLWHPTGSSIRYPELTVYTSHPQARIYTILAANDYHQLT